VTGDSIRKSTKVLKRTDGTWVGYNEHGKIVGHQPYIADVLVREVVFGLATIKMEKFKYVG
jgi:hypothetical protein